MAASACPSIEQIDLLDLGAPDRSSPARFIQHGGHGALDLMRLPAFSRETRRNANSAGPKRSANHTGVAARPGQRERSGEDFSARLLAWLWREDDEQRDLVMVPSNDQRSSLTAASAFAMGTWPPYSRPRSPRSTLLLLSLVIVVRSLPVIVRHLDVTGWFEPASRSVRAPTPTV